MFNFFAFAVACYSLGSRFTKIPKSNEFVRPNSLTQTQRIRRAKLVKRAPVSAEIK